MGRPEKMKKKKLPTYTVLIRTPAGTQTIIETNDFAKARRTYARYKGSCRLCIDERELMILEADKLMDDGSLRSKTFPGIAKAMASQWSEV